jgi:YggT family protein
MERLNIFYITRYIFGVVFSIIETLLMLRFILRLFGANAAAPFVNWVYETTYPLVSFFTGIFPNPNLQGVFVFEFATIFAIMAYILLYLLVVEVLSFFEDATSRRVVVVSK